MDNYLLERGIPLIHQDNENINFCFYVYHSAQPMGSSTWWSRIGCRSLTFTLVLPEGYMPSTDVPAPVGRSPPQREWYKDDTFSIFTTAKVQLKDYTELPSLKKELKDNRWVISGTWEGAYGSPPVSFYLEVHYRKMS
ncbi:MAG: hypothetical protein QXG10_05340 [Candidatus Hadarchaeales archaeon]